MEGRYKSAMEMIRSLRNHRKECGITLEQAAESSGMSASAISRLETGVRNNPTVETIERYADSLNIQVIWSIESKPDDSSVEMEYDNNI
jgi:XRE family transcriptional regulator, master regulator for biofilm formation